MTRNWFLSAGAVGLLVSIAACSGDNVHITGPKGQEAFAKYVSLGTSVSMGVMNDGVFYATQQTAWPALLAHQAFATSFTSPLLQGPGCYSPLIAPLSLGPKRLSGASYPGITAQDQVCALFANTVLPTNNVAVDGGDDIPGRPADRQQSAGDEANACQDPDRTPDPGRHELAEWAGREPIGLLVVLDRHLWISLWSAISDAP